MSACCDGYSDMFVFRGFALVGFFVGLIALPAATSLADIAHQKFARIETAKLPPGTRVDLSAAELNAWAADEARLYAPGAVRNIKLELTAGGATGSLSIDFLKLRQAATGEQPGWLIKNLFAGEKQVTVKAHFESKNRRARVDVDRVEISGVPIEGTTLDFLIENWLRPTFPDVKIDEWFDLGFRIDRFTASPAGASVFIGN
jgi:hypothetical protein